MGVCSAVHDTQTSEESDAHADAHALKAMNECTRRSGFGSADSGGVWCVLCREAKQAQMRYCLSPADKGAAPGGQAPLA